MQVLTEVKLRKVIREEIRTNHGHLSLREQRQLEEQLFQKFKAALSGAGAVAKKAGSAIAGAAGAAGAAAAKKVEGVAKAADAAVSKVASQISGKAKALANTTFDQMGEITKGIADAYSTGQAESLRAQAKQLKALAAKLEAQANSLKPEPEPAQAQQPAAAATTNREPAPTAAAVKPAVVAQPIRAVGELEEVAKRKKIKKITESVVRKLRTLEKKKARKRSS